MAVSRRHVQLELTHQGAELVFSFGKEKAFVSLLASQALLFSAILIGEESTVEKTSAGPSAVVTWR